MKVQLDTTLSAVAAAAAGIDEPWWVIGGAAAYLVGLAGESVADVDVLTTVSGAERIARAFGAAMHVPPPSDRFRSAIFARATETPLPVEIMGDLRLAALGWEVMMPHDRVAISFGGSTLFLPSVTEQIRILLLFGRDKDIGRAARLRHMRRE